MDATQTQLEALLTRAAFAPIHNVGWIRVTGEDRVRWLNGMVTNSIQALKPGEGCYNFFLNAQGRIQGDCTAWMQEDAILLQTAADRVDSLIGYLDRFIIMDDVELQSESSLMGYQYIGPEAADIFAEYDFPVPDPLHRLTLPLPMPDEWFSKAAHVLHAYSPLVPRFELWFDTGRLGMPRTIAGPGLSEASTEALEQLRLLEATPLYGVDIRDKDLPQETGVSRALHFAKGCYLGQEIVERIRSRGQVNRLLTPLTLHGELPAPGAILTANDKPAGEITSAADVPGHGLLGLGYVRREALDTHAALAYPGGSAVPLSVKNS